MFTKENRLYLSIVNKCNGYRIGIFIIIYEQTTNGHFENIFPIHWLYFILLHYKYIFIIFYTSSVEKSLIIMCNGFPSEGLCV